MLVRKTSELFDSFLQSPSLFSESLNFPFLSRISNHTKIRKFCKVQSGEQLGLEINTTVISSSKRAQSDIENHSLKHYIILILNDFLTSIHLVFYLNFIFLGEHTERCSLNFRCPPLQLPHLRDRYNMPRVH